MCSWIIIHGRFFFFAVPFAHFLCYNIKLTDYAIFVNFANKDKPCMVWWMCI